MVSIVVLVLLLASPHISGEIRSPNTYDFGLHNKYAKDVFLALFLPEGSETNQPEDSKSNDQITSIYMYLQEKMKQSVTFLNATTPVAFQSFRYLTEPINTAEL